MDKNLTVQKSIHIKAKPEKVWDALTDPKQVKKYFMGTTVKTDWKVGSPINFEGDYEGKSYMDKGTIIKNEKPKVLQYDYWSSFSGLPDTPENYSLVTYRLHEKAGGTELTATQEGFTSTDNKEHAKISWGMVLKNLKSLVE